MWVKYSGRQKVPTTTIGGRAHSACTQCEGELGESMWRKLEDEKLADRATIAHNLHLATLARDGEKAAALGKRGTRRTASTAASTARSRPSSGGRSRRR